MTPRDANPPSGGSRKPNRDRGGWRKGATPPAARSSASSASGSRSWWSARPKEQPRKSSFRTKLVLSLVAMTVLVAAFAAALMNRRDQVPFIAIGVTDYSSKLLPPNAWTHEDFERIEEIADDNALIGRSWFGTEGRSEIEFQRFSQSWGDREGTSDSISKRALLRLSEVLAKARPGGPDKSVILYISAHGVVDGAGKPCLLLRDSDPRDSGTWVKIEDLLATFCNASKANTNVLVLDSGRMETNAACGLLYQDFAQRLDKLVTDRQTDFQGLVVINSTSDGQIGWAAPERAGTVFGYFLGQALCGAADNDGSGSVSIRELKQFLEHTVSDYVRRQRASEQWPLVLTTGSSGALDRELTYCSGRNLSEAEQDTERDRLNAAQTLWNNEEEWKHIDHLWREHDKLKNRTPPIYRYEPVGWAKFERDLLRMEQLLLAGSAYVAEYKTLSNDTWAENHRLAQAADIVSYNLPLNARRSPPANAQPSPSDEKLAKVTPYPDLARLAWDRLLAKDSPTVADIGNALAPLEARPADQKPEPIEIHFLRMLAQYLEPGPPAELLKDALLARQSAEASASPLDERAQYWIRAGVEAGDRPRRLAEDLFFVGPANSKSPNAWREFERKQWEHATGEYKDAAGLGEVIGQALLLRDRAATELPYLADWAWQSLCRPSKIARTRGSNRVERINQSVRSWHLLCDKLSGSTAAASQTAQSIAEQVKQLDESLRDLTSEFAQDGRADDGGLQSSVRDIQRHLSFPLVKATDRTELRESFLKRLDTLCVQLKKNPGGTPPAEKQEEKQQEQEASDESQAKETDEDSGDAVARDAANTAATAEIKTALRDTRHPFLEWLGESNATPPGDKGMDFRVELDRQGEQVRARLAEAKTKVHDAKKAFREKLPAKSPEPSAADLQPTEVIELRQILSDADLTARQAANWQDQLPDPNESESVTDRVYAIDALRRFDWQQLMLWQARRTLDDFWGSLPAKPGTVVKPYFQAVAQEYLQAAALLGSNEAANQGHDRLLAACQTLLDARLLGLDQLPQLSAQSVTSGEGGSGAELPLTFSQPPPSNESIDLPHGVAAAFVRMPPYFKSLPLTEQNTPSPVADDKPLSRLAVALGTKAELATAGVAPLVASAKPQLFRFQPEPGVKALESVVWYRGHVRPNAINVMPPGVQIVYAPDEIVPAQVRVSGKETMPTSVVFILDCSYSMKKEDVPLEKGGKGQRFTVARASLIEILKDPALSQFRVGLCLYGHRFGISEKDSKVLLSKYAQKRGLEVGPQLQPGNDVEITHRVDFFDNQRRDEMIQTLRDVEPWGTTPLYLSIAQVAAEPIPSGEQRRIIAITDGLNQQDDFPAASKTTPESLRTALNRLARGTDQFPRIIVDIIGFGEELKREDQEKLKEMKKIASDYHGNWYSADTARNLLDSIKKSLQLGKFEVVPQIAGSEPPADHELETVWTEPKTKRLSEGNRTLKYQVEVVGIERAPPPMAIELQGGEALELAIERGSNGPTLMYPGYYFRGALRPLASNVDPRKLLEDDGTFVREQATGFEYWVSPGPKPKRRSQKPVSVTFYVQTQDFDRAHFTPRPAEAWIEVRPDIRGREVTRAELYRFCDLNFLPKEPVPQIVCEARDFPLSATNQADIDIWFTTKPLRSDDVQIRKAGELEHQPVIIDGVTLKARIEDQTAKVTRTLTIEESGATTPGQVKIHVEAKVAEIRHDYSRGLHHYEISSDVNPKECIVRMISVEKFKRHAMHASLQNEAVGDK